MVSQRSVTSQQNSGHKQGNKDIIEPRFFSLFPLSLTDPACRNSTCPADKPRVRLADGGGLYLEVAPNLSRRWFWKYYFGGKEKRLALGHYTETGSTKVVVSLKAAREARDSARKLLRSGIDPAQQRQLDKLTRHTAAGNSFEAVARELHATKQTGWSPRYADRWIERMEKDLFPALGSLPLVDVSAPMLLETLRRVEKRGANETAHTLRQTGGQVFRHGIHDRFTRAQVGGQQGSIEPVHAPNHQPGSCQSQKHSSHPPRKSTEGEDGKQRIVRMCPVEIQEEIGQAEPNESGPQNQNQQPALDPQAGRQPSFDPLPSAAVMAARFR